jgi:hypothetical protein
MHGLNSLQFSSDPELAEKNFQYFLAVPSKSAVDTKVRFDQSGVVEVPISGPEYCLP